MEASTKRCPRCSEEKALGAFGSKRTTADGLTSWCRNCKAADDSARRARNRKRNMALGVSRDGTKWCPRCRQSRPRTAFNLALASADGLGGWCHECDARSNAQRRAKAPWRMRAWHAANPGNAAAWKAANPEKVAAHNAVNHAIESGRLVRQPCEVCGAEPGHGHHDDYSKPLDVRWLCARCHAATHRAKRISPETQRWLTEEDNA